MDRRTFLRASGGLGLLGSVGLAGCVADAPSDGSTTQRVADEWEPGPGEWAFWPGYGPRGNRHNPHASPPATEPEVAWSRDNDGLHDHTWLAIADGTLYGRLESELYALDTDDGSEIWYDTHSEFGSIVYVDGRLYHTTRGENEALTLDGEREWRLDDPGSIVGETGGHVYVDTEDGVGWHDPETGDRLGELETDNRPNVIADGRLYGGSSDAIAAYEHDGEELVRLWEQEVEAPYDPSGGFVLAEDTLYVPEVGRHNDWRLETYGLDGERIDREDWENHQLSTVIVVDGTEYLLLDELDPDGGGFTDSHLVAREGAELWRTSFPAPSTRPVIADGTLYVADGEATLRAIDRLTGENLWELPDMGGQLAVVDETIYVNGHEFYALRAEA